MLLILQYRSSRFNSSLGILKHTFGYVVPAVQDQFQFLTRYSKTYSYITLSSVNSMFQFLTRYSKTRATQECCVQIGESFNSSLGILKLNCAVMLSLNKSSFNSSLGILKQLKQKAMSCLQRSFNSSLGILKH